MTPTHAGGSRELEDRDLVEHARDGDVAAYEELVRRYQRVAVRAAYIIAGAADAEDAAQEAFVKAFHALDRFRPDAAFRPWLLRIVTNEAKNRLRSVRRHHVLAERAAEQPIQHVPSPETDAVAEEARRTLLAALNRLSDDDRRVIGFRYFLDLPEAEIAEMLEVPRGTVKSRLSRALDRLRAVLEEGS